ncbi:MAG: hypothetical protein AAF849_18155 [Bacteroidota bacterium]
MKKYIAIIIFSVGLVTTHFANTSLSIDLECCEEFDQYLMGKVTLDAGTLIYLETNERIFTDGAMPGKIIQFKVKMNVIIKGKVVIRTGAAAIGRVKSVRAATYNNPAEITIELTSVQSVDGQQVSLNGTEQTLQGEFPNQGTLINIGTAITANVMNDTEIKV